MNLSKTLSSISGHLVALVLYKKPYNICFQIDMPRQGAMSRSFTRMSTPMVNAEVAENIVKNTIFRNWKQIQTQCRQRDVENSGTINVVDLKGIV